MALKKYYITTQASTTSTIKTNANGLIFNTIIYNLGDSNANIKYFLEDSTNNEIILLQTSIKAGEKIFLEEKISLEGEDIKIYSSADNIQVLTQILDNQY